MIVERVPRTVAMHQTGRLPELIAAVGDLSVSCSLQWLFRFFHPDLLESVSVPLDSGLALWFLLILKCDGSHGEPVPVRASRGLGYFLSLSWIPVSTVTSGSPAGGGDQEACYPTASCSPQARASGTAGTCRCLRESSWDPEDQPAELSPKCQAAELRAN